MKILFVATRKNSKPEDRELYEMEFMNKLLGFERSLLDLGIVTVAACTPKDVEIEIIDEYVDEIPYDTDADLVALSAKTSCVTHAYEVSEKFRANNIPVVLGGIHASLRPKEALEYVDYVVIGEAEKTWPKFVRSFQEGEAPSITNSEGFVNMDEIPVPAWDRIDTKKFLFHQIQTTRGCPFTCRFCSVPDISGNSFRFKSVDTVIQEIRALPSSGYLIDKIKALYVVDDNFISRISYTKKLLEALKPLYQKGELGEWSAETTLNVAYKEELLDMFKAAGCSTLILGLESISEETLISMDKKVNFSLSFPEAIERIHKRGLSIVGNFIVGFDTDTISVFRDTVNFINDNDILYPFFSILTPMPGTKLHEDYKKEDRLDHTNWHDYDTRHVVFKPKNMTREQLMDGYIWLYEESYTSKSAYDRLERYWKKYRTERSGFIEKIFIKWKLRKFKNEGTDRFQNVLKDGWQRLNNKEANSDIGQLIYYYDSAHFVDYLDQFKSANYEKNIEIFKNPEKYQHFDEDLKRKQWDRSLKEVIKHATQKERSAAGV